MKAIVVSRALLKSLSAMSITALCSAMPATLLPCPLLYRLSKWARAEAVRTQELTL